MSDTIKNLIEETAAEPLRARDQAMEVQNRSLAELIAADKHLSRKRAARNPLSVIRRAQIKFGRPGGLP